MATFFRAGLTAPPPPPPHCPPLWNSSRITARALFIPILCLLQHLAVAPPGPPCPLPAHPSSPLINRPWYWWELNAGKWLPVKAPRTPASHPACNHIQAWLACRPLTAACELVPLFFSWPSPSLRLSISLFIYHFVPFGSHVCCRSFSFQGSPGSVSVFTLVPESSVPLCHLLMSFHWDALSNCIKVLVWLKRQRK